MTATNRRRRSRTLPRPGGEGRDGAILVTLVGRDPEIVLLAHATVLPRLHPHPTDTINQSAPQRNRSPHSRSQGYTAAFAPSLMNPSSTARAAFACRCLRSGLESRFPFSRLGTAGTRPQLEFMGWRVPSLVVM